MKKSNYFVLVKLVEVQLKPNQQPLGVRKNWKRLLHNYSTATHLEAGWFLYTKSSLVIFIEFIIIWLYFVRI